MSDIKTTLDEYNKKLEALQKQCSQAEKDAIVAETNYQNLIKQKEQVIEELEVFAGVPFDQVSELLKKEQESLDEIMSRLSAINVNAPMTDEVLKELDSIMADFNIQPVS